MSTADTAGHPFHHAAEMGHPDLVRIYVWDRVVRLTHWGIVLAMIALIPTGLIIAHPSALGVHYSMAVVRYTHFYAATIFVASVLARAIWFFTGSRWARWDQILPFSRYRLKKLLECVKFYSLVNTKPAVTIGHNPMAGLSYAFAFACYLTLVTTGIALYSVDSSVGTPLHPLHFLIYWLGGAQWARLEHHIAMWFLIAFGIFHLYAGALTSRLEKTGELDSIFSGYKFFPPEEVEQDFEKGTRHG